MAKWNGRFTEKMRSQELTQKRQIASRYAEQQQQQSRKAGHPTRQDKPMAEARISPGQTKD
jgi:hypothetical protein